MMRSVVGSIHRGGSIELFLFPASSPQLVEQNRGTCYPVYGMVHINNLLIGKRSPSSDCSGFPLSLSEWSFTMSDAI